MTTPLVDYSLASVDHHIHVHASIHTQQRKQSVAHKSGRQFFGMDVRGMRTSLQDDTGNGYNLDGREIWNFDKFSELSFARAPRLRPRECRRKYKYCHGLMVRWNIIWVGLSIKVFIAMTHIPLETGDRWFEYGKNQLHFLWRWYIWMTKACLDNRRRWNSH